MDNFFANPATEVLKVSADAVIGEGKHRNRVATDEGGANRSSDEHGCFASSEHWRIAALRKVDDDFIGSPFLAVVVHQLGAKPTRLNAHDGVGPRVERLFLPEDLDADDVLLQF